MNKKMVLLVLISFSLLLWMLSSLFIAFVKAVPEGIGVEENCLTKQDFANVASSCNRQYSFLRGDGERICVTEATASSADTVNVVFEEAHDPAGDSVMDGYSEFASYLVAHEYAVSTIDLPTIIDSSVLAPVDVLVIVSPVNDYSTSEIDVIETWVRSGGSLLLISDWGNFSIVPNTIAERFGINLAEDAILDNDSSYVIYNGSNLRPHPITAGVTSVEMYTSDGILNAPADEIPLIVTDSDGTTTWYSDDSLASGVSVMSAIDGGTTGSGRLVIITDCCLWSTRDTDDDGEINFYEGDNEILALNTIDWLAACGFVDLKITDVYWEPSEPEPDDDVTFYAKVVNQGDENATDFKVELYLDEELYASATLSLAAGANDTYWNTYPWTATLGNHTVRWVIDATNVIVESNEDNNEMSETFMVGYVLTVQTPYSHITVKIDGSSNLTDSDGNFQTYVGSGSHDVEVQTPVSLGPGSRGVFVQWSDGDSSNPRTIFVDDNLSLTAEYMTQYYLTVDSPYGTPGGEGWYDNCTTAYATLDTDIVDHLNGTRRVFTHWGGDASGTNYAQSDPIHMDGPKTATANWKTQYLVTFAQTGLDATATGTVVTVNGDTKTFSDLPYTTWVDSGDSISYSYSGIVSSSTSGKRFSLVDVTGPDSPISVTGPVTVTGNYKTQYYLTMSTNFGTVTPSSGWHDAGSTVQISASAPDVVDGEQYVWLGWTGTGTGSYSGMDNPASITMDGPITETAAWRHEYYLTVTSPYGSPTPESGWFEAGESITASITSPASGPSGTRYVCTGWTGTGSVPTSGTTTSVTFTIEEPSSITWNWKTQYLLTIRTDPTGPSPQPTRDPAGEAGLGGWWYDDGTPVTCTAQKISEHEFDHWTVDETNQGSHVNPIAITMDSPHTAIAIYHFPIHEPIGWQDYLCKPEIIGLFIALFSVICTVTAFVATRRKRGRVKSLLTEIDNAYFSFKMNARRCEAELYRLKDIVLEEYKSGKIIEESYDILNERIDNYIKEVREQNK